MKINLTFENDRQALLQVWRENQDKADTFDDDILVRQESVRVTDDDGLPTELDVRLADGEYVRLDGLGDE